MFTVDLLRGKGLPPRSGLLGLAILAATVLVPVAVIICVLGQYYVNSAKISAVRQEMKLRDVEMARMSDAVAFKNRFESKKKAVNGYLTEINSCIRRCPQWSPIIKVLVENLPESVILDKLEVTHETIRKQVPSKDDSSKMVEMNVPYKRLHMSLACGTSNEFDRKIKDFRDTMKNSEYLGPKLEDINIAQEVGKGGNSQKMMYELYFIFRADI